MQSTKQEEKVKCGINLDIGLPSKYHVYVLDDDVTPGEFVIGIILAFFNKSLPETIMILEEAEKETKGFVGTYTYDMAVTKTSLSESIARSQKFPLSFEIKKAE